MFEEAFLLSQVPQGDLLCRGGAVEVLALGAEEAGLGDALLVVDDGEEGLVLVLLGDIPEYNEAVLS